MPDEKTPEQIEAEAKAAAEAKAVEEAKAAEAAKTNPLTEAVAKLEAIVATLTEKKAKNEAKIAELTEKLTATEKSFAEAQATIEAANVAKRFNDLEGKVDSLIGEKKILPAQKPAIMKLLSEIPLNKTYKDGELENTVETLIFNIFKGNASVKLNTEEQSQAGAKGNEMDEVAQIQKISKEKGISYKEAYKLWKNKKQPSLP